LQWTFDNTICYDKYPDVGDFLPGAVETLKSLADEGHELVLWTCRRDEAAQRAYKHCLDAGIPFKYMNEGMYDGELHQYKKLFADLYIDNCNFGNAEKIKEPANWDYIAGNLLGKNNARTLWKGKYIQVISPDCASYEAVQNMPNGRSVIVFLADTSNKIAFIRREHCPPYEYETGIKHWYTVISGGVEENEKPYEAMIREIKEETGIDAVKEQAVFTRLYVGKFNKTLVDTVTVFLVKIDHKPDIEKPEGDGTLYEKESSTVAVPYNEIELLKPRDFLLEAVWAMSKPLLS